MPFDIAPVIKISETGHITVDDEEAMEMPGDIPIKECSCDGSRRRQQ